MAPHHTAGLAGAQQSIATFITSSQQMPILRHQQVSVPPNPYTADLGAGMETTHRAEELKDLVISRSTLELHNLNHGGI